MFQPLKRDKFAAFMDMPSDKDHEWIADTVYSDVVDGVYGNVVFVTPETDIIGVL